MFGDETKACDIGWQALLAIPGLSDEVRKVLVPLVLQIKSKYDNILNLTIKTHESNIKCLAKLIQSNQEKDALKHLYSDSVEVDL